MKHSLLIYSLDDHLCHMIDHLIRHAGVHADPESVVHNKVGIGQLAHHAVCVGAADLVEARVFDQIAAEQEARLHVVLLDKTSPCCDPSRSRA